MKVNFRILLILFALVFMFQAISQKALVDVYFVLNIFGFGNNILDIVMVIVYITAIIVLLYLVTLFLKKINIITSVRRNEIILRYVIEYVRFFLVFFPSWITFAFFNGESGLNLSNPNINLEIFLNLYLFWYFLCLYFFRPQIDSSD